MTVPSYEAGRRIVVGVDGSPGSKTALRWAMTQARLIEATVEAVVAWQDPVMYGAASLGYAPAVLDGDSTATIMAKVLDDTIAEVTATLDQPVVVRPQIRQGHPAQVLLHASVGAELLVVGSRGHSTFAGILLGSVSQHCVQHAQCAVVVVPSDDQTREITGAAHDQPTVSAVVKKALVTGDPGEGAAEIKTSGRLHRD
jgi:Universal stress protein UspA and related nucleotide-binding proteins